MHQRIDAIVDGARIGPEAEICGDAEFARRLSLDLLGMIPTAEQVREFLDNPAPGKRVELIDRYLTDQRLAHHLQNVFDVMLMERRPQKHVKLDQWRSYLLEAFRQNRPLNELLQDVLWADPDDESLQAVSRFYLAREVQPHLVTRDVGRLMLGRDLQCAQCHDHPTIVDYEQAEYYGIYAFVSRSYLFNDKKNKKKPVVLAEKAEGDVSFESVFDQGTKYRIGPRLPGQPAIEEPDLAKDEIYKVKPPKGGRGIPAFSRRKQLAERLTAGDYETFNRNLANRLWAVMFGRGIVHPLDLHHGDNPPVHPELLDVLAEELAAMNFDVRAFLRQIALSRTYQRSVRLPEKLKSAHENAKQVLAEQAKRRDEFAEQADAAGSDVYRLKRRISDLQQAELDTAAKLAKAKAEHDKAAKALAESAKKAGPLQSAVDAKSTAAQGAADQLAKAQDEAAASPDDPSLAKKVAELDKASQQAQEALKQARQPLEKHQAAHQKLQQAEKEALQAMKTAEAEHAAAEKRTTQVAQLQKQLNEARDKAQAARDQANVAREMIADAETLIALAGAPDPSAAKESREKLTTRWSHRFFVRGLRPLSPQQMALSLHQAVEDLPARLASARAAERDKLVQAQQAKKDEEKGKPDGKQDKQKQASEKRDDAKEKGDKPIVVDQRLVERRAHQAVYSQLRGVIDEMAGIFSQGDGQPTEDFQGRSQEALYLANSPRIKGLVSGRLSQRLAALKETDELADELYLAVLSRRPGSAEVGAVQEFLAGRDEDRKIAVEEMIWGLLSSAEFRFNH